MILYHYTNPANVYLITHTGLQPAASEENVFMSCSFPVVWLTREESNRATSAHIEFFRSRCPDADYCEGDIMFGGSARVSVHLERHDKRLVRYADFLRKCGTDMKEMNTIHMPRVLTSWWVYLGTIPPHKIDTRIPAALMLECLDHHIETHPDWDARARYVKMREKVIPLAPDELVSFALS